MAFKKFSNADEDEIRPVCLGFHQANIICH